jgi:hypothetical protein
MAAPQRATGGRPWQVYSGTAPSEVSTVEIIDIQ